MFHPGGFPPRGLVKINVDAAVSKNSSKAVAAAIARDAAAQIEEA